MARTYGTGPKSQAAPCFWLQADNGYTLDYTSSRTSASQMVQLATTTDIVSNGTKGAQPSWGVNYINKKPVLTFDGSSHRLFQTGTTVCKGVPGFTMIAVMRRNAADVSVANANYIFHTSTNSGVSSTNERAYLGINTGDLLICGGRKADTDAINGCNSMTALKRGKTYVVAGVLDYANNKAKTYINGICDTYQDPTGLQTGITDPVNQGSVNGVGFETSSSGTTNTNTTGNGISVGGKAGGTNFFNGDIGKIICWPFAMTDAQVQAEVAKMANEYDIAYRSTYTTWLTFDGSSSTYGTGLLGADKLPEQILALAGNPKNVGYINDGVSGSTLSSQTTDAAAADGIDNREIPPNVQSGKRVLVCALGTNDIVNGTSAATTLANLRTYIQARKASGKYDGIVLWLPQVRQNATVTANILAYNALVLANLSTLKADGLTDLLDTTKITHLNTDGDYNNTTYYQADLIHLTAAGMALVANGLYPLLKKYF